MLIGIWKMRMSCNGCRVLRKGCHEDCCIKPCLDWIKSPASQSNATLFLAKFYGRAGLINLINAAPHHLRPATFRSLLYESCGRMVNPIYGSVGLIWSGQWHLCQSAVESVLKGIPITPIPSETATNLPPIKSPHDIRHVTTKDKTSDTGKTKQAKSNQSWFKRSNGVNKPRATKLSSSSAAAALAMMHSHGADTGEFNGSSTSHDDSSVSHPEESTEDLRNRSCMGDVSKKENEGVGLELKLTLGFGMTDLSCMPRRGNEPGGCKMELGLV